MYLLLKSFAATISLLPARAIEQFAGFLARLTFDTLRLRRALVLKNLNIALGDVYTKEELVEIGRTSYKNFLLTIFEFFRSQKHNISAHFEIKGEEHIQKALSKNQGVYVLCFHLGNWEAMGSYITRNIAPAHVLVKKVGGGGVNRFVEELREHNNFLWVKRRKKGDGFRGIREVLDKGEIVGFVMDQSRPGEPRLPFFGVPAKTNTSMAAIWKRRQAPIVTAYVHRKALGHHILEFCPELELPASNSNENDIIEHSTIFNKEVEKAVRKYPEHYFWLHNRWKS